MATPSITYQGKPCKHGHVGVRYLSNGNCVECWKDIWSKGRITTSRPQEKHGYRKRPIYGVWSRMIQRCYNPNNKDYPNYGGRGIKVCDRWRNSFRAFLADVGDRPGPGSLLDRIDNDGHYEPGNVRWVPATVSARNTRAVRLSLDKARAIRILYQTGGFTHKLLGKMFSVAEETIQFVLANKTWRE